jgi:hypothetical protein
LLLLVFVAGAIATWVAGTALSKTTDVIDRRFNLALLTHPWVVGSAKR